MLFRIRPSSLLLLALLGAGGVAVAGPAAAAHQDPPDKREAARERASQARSMRESRMSREMQMPQRTMERPEARESRPPPRQERRQRQEDLSDSVRRVEQRTRGRVLSAERVPYDGRNLNRIKVIDENGRVRVFMDDPQQGGRTRGDDD